MKTLRTLFYTVFIVGIAMLLFRMSVMSVISIPEDGERPVFYAGDRVTVDKTAYGLRLPFIRWTGYKRIGNVDAERGEWLLFNTPDTVQNSVPIDERSLYIGYCYAQPGDSIWIDRKGRIYRDRPSHSKQCLVMEVPRKNAYVVINKNNINTYSHIIKWHEGKNTVIVSDSLFIDGNHIRSFCFTQNYYWVHSANPENCLDSRTFGFVPEKHIIGQLKHIVFSWDKSSEWYRKIRFERIGMKVGKEN